MSPGVNSLLDFPGFNIERKTYYVLVIQGNLRFFIYVLHSLGHKIKFVKIIAGCGGSVITIAPSSLGLLCQRTRFTSEIYGHLNFNTVL